MDFYTVTVGHYDNGKPDMGTTVYDGISGRYAQAVYHRAVDELHTLYKVGRREVYAELAYESLDEDGMCCDSGYIARETWGARESEHMVGGVIAAVALCLTILACLV